jgi:hypothetical protein
MADDKDKDGLLSSLGQIAAEAERAGEASEWERLARGELSPERVAALERRAEEDEDVKALLIASRPFDAAAKERIAGALADAIAEQRAREKDNGVSGAKRVAAVASRRQDEPQSPAPAPDNVRRLRWRSRVPIVVGAVAIAAAVAFVLRPSASGDLPLYAIESSGASSSRAPSTSASSACVLHTSATGSFELVVRANDAVRGAVVAHAFALRGKELVRVASEIDVSETGSVRLSAANETLEDASAIVIVVGRPEVVGPAERALAKAKTNATSGAGWQALRCTVE